MTPHLVHEGSLYRLRRLPTPLVPFDSVLDRTGRRQVERLATIVEAGPGRILAAEGEIGGALLILVEGFVKLWKALPADRRQIMAFRVAGELISLHRQDTPWPVTAEAVTSCRLFRIEWADLRRLASRYPAIDRVLLDLASDEISDLQGRLLMLGRKTAEEKLATFVLEFSPSSGTSASLGREIHLPIRRPEIAEYLGLTTESVSREFSRFKRERLIAMPRPSRIIVLNRPALVAMASGTTGSSHGEEFQPTSRLEHLAASE